jgi:hypothetical protein
MARNTLVADGLKNAAMSYFAHKGYSCFPEIGVNSWGKLRADVMCLNMKCHLILCEIKSSVADYSSDSKWKGYLSYSNKMYFIFTEQVFDKLEKRLSGDLRGTGVGVLVLDTVSGLLRCVQPASNRKMVGKVKKDIVVRMAWRNGVSKRTNKQRKRVFIGEANLDNLC